jgi:CheY-like chemotaxis protein
MTMWNDRDRTTLGPAPTGGTGGTGGPLIARRRATAGPARASRPIRVLFIDPDLPAAEWLAQTIAHDCAIGFARSRAEAWFLMEAHVPDLIVTELDLPDVAGPTFVQELRGLPVTRNTLLMVLTRRRTLIDKISSLQAGADAYLVKPVNPLHFELAVRQLAHFCQVIHELPSLFIGSGAVR